MWEPGESPILGHSTETIGDPDYAIHVVASDANFLDLKLYLASPAWAVPRPLFGHNPVAKRQHRERPALRPCRASRAEKLAHFLPKDARGHNEAQGKNNHAKNAQRARDARGVRIDAPQELVNRFGNREI